jgi:hypothetical protein
MAKRQRRLLHGWKLTEATHERAKKFCRVTERFSRQNAATFALSFIKNRDWRWEWPPA